MVQYNKIIKNKKKGFTLVELMVVLVITAILAALVGGGLIAYTRLARFEKNEANARTLFQTAQISLTRMETAGELDAFRQQVMEEGSRGDHFQNDVTVTDAGGNTLVSRTRAELNQNVAALYYDRTGAAAGNHNALVKELLGDYIYDASLLNASICVEIDVQSGQVYSVFYDTKSDKLRFNKDGATNIYDRSYDHRRNDSLVGYYSAEDRVNVVQLVQTKLKVKNPRLTNGETLTLSWSGNSSLGDLDTSYTATAYDKNDKNQNNPLFTITIKRDTAGAADDNKQVITKMPVTIYTYDNAGNQTKTEEKLCFPLSYNKGSFVLTLDAMADAALLRASENSAEVAATSLYSITRLLNDPQDIYIAMRAEPRENYSDTYTASKEETTNEENTLLAKGGTANVAELKYFRHLYNLRWSADWKIADKGTYTLTPQANNSTGLNWTGGGVTVYCAAGEQYPAAKVPSLNDPVAWPTIPELGEKIVLTSKTAGLTTQTTRVPILNLQLSSKSVAKTCKAKQDVLTDHYVGLIGENKGKISYITLRDPDIQVNVKTETVAAGTPTGENQLKLTATKFVTALEDTDENWRDVRAVGALCGVNTGTLENCALTRGTNSSTSALVAAALAFGDTTTETKREAQTLTAGGKKYTYYIDEPRGIGGLVGVAIPETGSVMQNLTVASDVTVAGLLVDENTKNVKTTTAADQQAEKARYAAAAANPGADGSLWRSVGVGGVFGTVDAAEMQTTDKTNIVNNGFVTGNGFTGGIVGNLFTTGAGTSAPQLTGLTNNGTVSAGANYKGDTKGDARSLVLGQFFGGIAGYGRGVTLQNCNSVTRSDLTETQLKEQVKEGFDTNGALTDASPLKGDFVGGLVGYGKDITLDDCKTGKGYVLGSRFVGGLAGGFTGSGVKQNDTNSSDVFGSRYVGGIVSVNGSGSEISGMTNTGLVAAFGKNAAYVGGIVGVNDADWGGSNDPAAKATVLNCANRMSGDNATDTRRINLLKDLSGYADYVGGIAGYNGKNGVVTWDTKGTPTLGAILYGNNYVGGVAGYNDEKATISNTSGKDLTISGQIVAAGKAVGGMIGLNCAPKLPSATVAVSRVAGQQLVGGVIGANLPVGSFTVANDGAFKTDVASGRVEADAVAGGIIGYNRLLKSKSADVTLAALLPTIDADTGVLTDSADADTANGEVILADFQNKLNLQADIYVGGIVGANDANTKLTIQDATNGATQNALSVGGLNPSNGAFKGGVKLSELAGDRYNFADARGALAGGIIGYATPNTTLKDCTNYGTVAHKCAAGGFAGWNEGTITGGSMAASLGNRETGYTYLGGVAGVNGGLIQSAYPAKDCAVRGDSYVGGIAGVNLGVNAAASKGLIVCTDNTSAASVEANQYAGGVAGANVGNISLSGSALQSSVTATNYAGGVAGINEYTGSIYGAENATGEVRGSVTATNYAGGVAGTNSAEITRVENHASVRANAKYAGGIAGVNDEGGKISHCSHEASYTDAVYATNGEAGGIAGNNGIAGKNNKDALIENVQVSADVTAANGTAGGVTATNFGIIGQGGGLEANSSVSGCLITGTSESIGAIAAYNRKDAVIRNVKLAANAGVQFSTPAVTIGGLAGMNEGVVTGCQVGNGALALDSGLRAGTNTVTLGGAVGRTTADGTQNDVLTTETQPVYNGTVSSTDVLLDLTQNLDKYTNLGGVAGQNDGTLDQCTYSGTMGGNVGNNGSINGGAASAGSTMGGIAGVNNNLIENCTVTHISLQAQGAFNVTDAQTADQKLQNASHVGGIAGCNANNGIIRSSYIAVDSGSLVAARYGFVGGVAGSNSGKITDSGSRAAFVSGENTRPLMTKIKYWLAQDDGSGNALTSSVKYARLNAMLDILKYGKSKDTSESQENQNKYTYDYAALHGKDTVPQTQNNSYSAYSDTALGSNALTVALRGCTSDNDRANGYLGGITGFNATSGSIVSTATGNWFVYGDNVSTGSTVGGAVGQNETAAEMTHVVNCAAVRRFTRVNNTPDYSSDNIWADNRVDTQVGGLICNQQNRTSDAWEITGSVNLGTVFNSRSFNAGGIISLWENYGGTLEYCYNLGTLQTNTNDKKGAAGAVGGIAGYLREPVSGSATNIISCSNYGDILWTKAQDGVVYGANDVGGILGKIEMASGNDYMTLNIIDCVNGPVTLQAKSMVSGIMGWMGQYDDAPKYVQVNIDRCRNLSYNLQVNGKNTFDAYVFVAGIVGNRGGGNKVASKISATTSVTNCFAVYNVATSGIYTEDGAYPIQSKSYSPIAFLRTAEDKVECTNSYYIDRSSLNYGDRNGGFFSRAFETMRHTPDASAQSPHSGWITNVPYEHLSTAITNNKYGKSLFLGIDLDEAGAKKFFAAAMQADKSAKTDYKNVDGRQDYIETTTTPKTIVRNSGTNTTVQASLLLWFSDIAKQDYTSGADGYPGFADITDEAIQEYYLNVLDSEKPQAPTNVQIKESRTTTDDNKVYGRYEVTWDEPKNNAHPASYYTVEVLPSDENGNITNKTPLLTADVFERRYTFENRTNMENQSSYFVVRVTPHNGCTTGDDNVAVSQAKQFLTALPTPEIEVRLVRTPGVNWSTGDNNSTFAYEQMLVLTNYEDYKDIAGWKVTVTAVKEGTNESDTFEFSAEEGYQKHIRNAMGGSRPERTTRITAYAETTNKDSRWMRSGQYMESAYIPSAWMGKNNTWRTENGLAPGNLTTSNITFTGNTVDNLTITATLNFAPTYTTQGVPIYRVMLRAKYTGNDKVTLNGTEYSLKGQYVTLAAQERTVANTDTTFTLSGLPKDTLTNYEDWTAIAVPINSGVGDVVTRWKITEQEAAESLIAYGTKAWWMNGLEIVRKADGTGYEYATLTPLCMVDTNHTEYRKWADAVADKVKLVKMTKTILKAPTLAEDTDGGEVDAKNQLTYTFKWTQDGMTGTTAPNYQIKLYGLLTDAEGNVTGQEQIALKDDVTLTPTQNGGNEFTLPVNVDTMLANGSDSWRYDKVRLEVTRVAAAGTTEIGASAAADYSVKQRLPGISAPSSITRVNGETDNADALLYTVSWSPSDDKRIDHYDLCAVDASGKTVLPLSTTGNVGSLTLDLEQYQGKTLRFRVIARSNDDSRFDGPDGALSQSETIVSRADAPTVKASSFAPDSPNQETFLNDLKLNMTLNAAAEGNVYFTGYIFSKADNYNTIAGLAEAWQKLSAGQDKYTAQQKLTEALNTMLANGDAELVIPKDSRTVGGSADANDTNASYTFVPDGNGFTLTPDHAKQYLLPAVRVMPTNGTTASNWFYIQRDAAAAQLPAITLDTPVDAAEPERALGNAVYTQEVNLYNDPECTAKRGTAPLDLRRFTVEWTAVNKYTQADSTVRNLTDSYSFTVTPLNGKAYDITVTTYDKDVTDDKGTTHKRGEIKTVTKTYDGEKKELEKQTTVDKETGETRIWYDLSVEPVYDNDNKLTDWEQNPYYVTGTVEIEGGTLYYKAKTVPMLELVQEDGAEPVYRITLPELQEKVQDDSLELQKFTASVELQTLAHSIGDKTVASDQVTVTVNGTNTAEAAEDAQSMDPAESMEDAEAVESTAAVSAPASVPPVLVRARAALPTATPETADAPDEADAAGTTPSEQVETTDAS